MEWEAHQHPIHGTMYRSIGADDGWEITFPRRAPEQPTVELRYGVREAGYDDIHMLGIGRFASAAEAMLAARMFADGDARADYAAVRVERAAMGFCPWIGTDDVLASHEKLVLGTDGRFLLDTGVGKDHKEDGLEFVGPEGRCLVTRMWSSTVGDNLNTPGSYPESARAMEEAILMELLRIRLERGPGRYAEPMTLDEFGRWEEARRGETADPADPDGEPAPPRLGF